MFIIINPGRLLLLFLFLTIALGGAAQSVSAAGIPRVAGPLMQKPGSSVSADPGRGCPEKAVFLFPDLASLKVAQAGVILPGGPHREFGFLLQTVTPSPSSPESDKTIRLMILLIGGLVVLTILLIVVVIVVLKKFKQIV